MKKIIVILCLALTIFTCISCKKVETSNVNLDSEEIKSENTDGGSEEAVTIEYSKEIKINFSANDNERNLTYQHDEPLVLPDGTTVSRGELKPLWQDIEKNMEFSIIDVTNPEYKSSELIEEGLRNGFTDATIYGGIDTAEDLMNYGTKGYFINLNEYIDMLPNFSNYLDENSNIKEIITAHNGGIYNIPYVSEIGNYARMFAGREAFVTNLLDTDEFLLDESSELDIQYQAYWTDRNETNVITLQNEAAIDGNIDRNAALRVLVNYIEATYPELNNPSELYLGETAIYDMDELVALMRVIKLSPNTLSKVATGSLVEDAQIVPFFTRKPKDYQTVLRLATYFGGAKVYSADSWESRLFVDDDGEMHYSFAEDDFLEAVDKIEDMYAEGLIHEEFSNLEYDGEFRNNLYASDDIMGQKEFGFMTIDWIASTSVSNDDVVGILPPMTTIEEAGISEFIHYIENARSIKPDGWAISSAASDAEINSALKLLDSFFTEEGSRLQTYGIEDGIEKDEVFLGPDGAEYPKINSWVYENAEKYTTGDISTFQRDYVGALLPIGYEKDIGLELQYTVENGFDAWDLYIKKDVKMMSYDDDNVYFRMMAPVLSLTEREVAKIRGTSIGNEQLDEIIKFIANDADAVDTIEDIKNMYQEAGIETYLEVSKDAYDRTNK